MRSIGVGESVAKLIGVTEAFDVRLHCWRRLAADALVIIVVGVLILILQFLNFQLILSASQPVCFSFAA